MLQVRVLFKVMPVIFFVIWFLSTIFTILGDILQFCFIVSANFLGHNGGIIHLFLKQWQLGFKDNDPSTVQSCKNEDALVLHGVDQSEGHLSQFL